MSTYLVAEAALLAVCRAYDPGSGAVFGPANSSVDDWTVLDSTTSDEALIVEMGGESIEGDVIDRRGSQGMVQERHQLAVTLAIKVGTGEQGPSAIVGRLKARTESLKDWLRRCDRLGVYGVVAMARPARTSAVVWRAPRPSAAPTHAVQTITVLVYCESEYTGEEGGY